MDLLTIFLILGIVQGFFVGFLLITKKSKNRIANRIAAFLFFSFSISIIHFVFVRNNLYTSYAHFLWVSYPVLFLFGPLCYLHVSRLIHKKPVSNRAYLLHLLPFFLVVLYFLPFFFSSAETKLQCYTQNKPEMNSVGHRMMDILQIIQLSVYLILTHREVRLYRQKLKDAVANMEKINLNHIRIGIYAFIVIFGFTFAILLGAFAGYKIEWIYLEWMSILVPIAIYVTGYYTIRQDELADVEFLQQTQAKDIEAKAEIQDFEAEKNKVTAIMETRKIYLKNILSIQMLADEVGMTLHELSRVINDGFGCNFYDFVNQYRVTAAKNMLQSPEFENYTVLAIAEESGFNSKSAFNSAFRKFTGKTPTEFRRNK